MTEENNGSSDDCGTITVVPNKIPGEISAVPMIPEEFSNLVNKVNPDYVLRVFNKRSPFQYSNYGLVNQGYFFTLFDNADSWGFDFYCLLDGMVYATYGYDFESWSDFNRAIQEYQQSSYFVKPHSESVKYYFARGVGRSTKEVEKFDGFSRYYVGFIKLRFKIAESFERFCSKNWVRADHRYYDDTRMVNSYRISEYNECHEKGFGDISLGQYDNYRLFGFGDSKELDDFKQSNFNYGLTEEEFKKSDYVDYEKGDRSFWSYRSTILDEYKKAMAAGFCNREEWLLAVRLEIHDHLEFTKFLKHVNKSDIRYILNNGMDEIRAEYGTYTAQEKGFKTLADYQNALKLKIDDADLFYEFQSSGCGSMEEFNTLKNEIPVEMENLKKIEQNALAKAEDGLSNKDASTYVHFAYTTLEKRVERLRLSMFPKFQEVDESEVLEQTLHNIGSEIGLDLPESGKITHWRRLRNEIVHNAKDVDLKEGMSAKRFLEPLFEEIGRAIEKNLNQTLRDAS